MGIAEATFRDKDDVAKQEKIASRNVWVLTAAQSLGGANSPIVISLGGLVGQHLASDPAAATLPVSMLNLGLALGTLPAAAVMRRFGRRAGYIIGAALGTIAGIVATMGIVQSSFIVFCMGTLIAGFYSAYVQSYRFAATDGLTGAGRDRAISRVMVGGLIAAIIGPQLVIWTRNALPGHAFAGSFLSQAMLALLAVPILLPLRRPAGSAAVHATAISARPLAQILTSPRYLLAVATGVVSYGLMTFVMTAAPMAMVGHGHSVDSAALGIQWHVLAMFDVRAKLHYRPPHGTLRQGARGGGGTSPDRRVGAYCAQRCRYRALLGIAYPLGAGLELRLHWRHGDGCRVSFAIRTRQDAGR
ncbi:MFS family permease [Rhizobium leucaenae]|nr:MFS family permease [Rhizobium leucaenae]